MEEVRIMQYISTRGKAARGSLSEVTLAGLASDRGLYIPETIPLVSPAFIERMRAMSYPEVAAAIFGMFAMNDPIFTPEAINEIVAVAYDRRKWEKPDIVPVVALHDQLFATELFRGPTLSFKDLALQMLAPAIDRILAARGARLTIAAATSGDTGSAAMEAFAGIPSVDMFMMFPRGGTSRIQRKQMTTIEANNVHAIAVDGTFDDCQAVVKFLDYGAVNSINWFRIMAQIAYYFWSYVRADDTGKPVNFSVPTGNFGDILAGHFAKQMGLPIHRLILCSNENDMLVRFFETGEYRPKVIVPTDAPSIDISVSSNLERLLYLLCRDPELVARLYGRDLVQDGYFRFDLELLRKSGIVAMSAPTSRRHEVMRIAQDEYAYLIDPHTAAAFAGALEKRDAGIPTIILATASLAKFDETAQKVLGLTVPMPAQYAGLENHPERFVEFPPDARMIRNYIERVVHP